MSFFKDFKEDFTQAMNELMPDGNEMYDDNVLTDTELDAEELLAELENKTSVKKEKPVKEKRTTRGKKKTVEETQKETRKVKATRPPKEIPLKEKIAEEPELESMELAPEDMLDQIDDLLDYELYSDKENHGSLLSDDMEVNTMDMSVEELLHQLSDKQSADIEEHTDIEERDIDDLQETGDNTEELSVDELLSQLERAIPEVPNEEIEIQTEEDPASAILPETKGYTGEPDMGLEALLDSIGARNHSIEEADSEPKQVRQEPSKLQKTVEAFAIESVQNTEEVGLPETIEDAEEAELPETIENAEEAELPETTEDAEEAELPETIEDVEEAELPEEFEEASRELEVLEEPELPDLTSIQEEDTIPVMENSLEEDEKATEEDALDQLLEELPEKAGDSTVRVLAEQLTENKEAVTTEEASNELHEDDRKSVQIEQLKADQPEEDMVVEEDKHEQTESEENEYNMEVNTMSEEKDVISISPVGETKEIPEEKPFHIEDADSETTYITKGTKISGDLDTDGSIDIIGTIEGNVSCKGKVVVGGTVKGTVTAGELYANSARIEGDVKSYGSVKVGVGSMIIGSIVGESAVIAGAVNGDIDVQGPVIVDSTAVIMGNIKSRSVQINNGAVIEGFCSQSYSDIDVKSFFA